MVADTQEGSRCHQLEVMSGLAVGMTHTHAALGFLHDGFILLFLPTSLGGPYMNGMLLLAITYPYEVALEVARRWRCIS